MADIYSKMAHRDDTKRADDRMYRKKRLWAAAYLSEGFWLVMKKTRGVKASTHAFTLT
jgi:hypothetical protein